MTTDDKVNILLVDDQPSKLLTYEVILRELGDHLLQATSAQDALSLLLKNEIAVVLMDVCMPELDGFQLASMIREHPRFRKVAMILSVDCVTTIAEANSTRLPPVRFEKPTVAVSPIRTDTRR